MNDEIRNAAKFAGVPLWKIAHKMGISDMTLYRWMRKELTEDKRRRIIDALVSASTEVDNG